MRALVTGGGGFLGRWIVKKLRSRGDEVRILARSEYPDLRADGVETVRGSVADRTAVEEACHDRDVVFHVAALAGIWGPADEYQRTNVTGTENVLAACRQMNVPKLVYTSSPSVVFPPGAVAIEGVDESLPYPDKFGCTYSETKAAAERQILAANNATLSTTSLRPHLIWGPGDNHLIPRLLDRARSGKLVRVGNGTNLVDLTYVENAADAHVMAADRLAPGSTVAGNAYFISDGAPVSLWSWINDLLQRLGMAPVKRSISYTAAYGIGAAMEAAYIAMGWTSEPRMTRFLASQLAGPHWFSIDRARRDLGYQPAVNNETGVVRLIEWLNSRPK